MHNVILIGGRLYQMIVNFARMIQLRWPSRKASLNEECARVCINKVIRLGLYSLFGLLRLDLQK